MQGLFRSSLKYSATRLRRFSSSVKGETLWKRYNEKVQSHPLMTKTITAGFLSFVADIVCQVGFPPVGKPITDTEILLESNSGKAEVIKSLDWPRVAKFTFLNAVWIAPALHFWYGFINRSIPGKGMTAVIQRLGLDQLLFAPILIATIFANSLILEGKPEKIVDKIKADWPETIMANYSVWVPCQFVNFRYVPPHLHVLVANIVGFFWNIYLSYSTFKEVESTVKTKED